jgi:hypothetical protein
MSQTIALFTADESPSDGFEEGRQQIWPRALSLLEVIRPRPANQPGYQF